MAVNSNSVYPVRNDDAQPIEALQRRGAPFAGADCNRRRSIMKPIHTVLMEEHRDAYYHWHRMIERGDIPAEGNYLLHIDHHNDMEAEGYDWDLTRMPQNAAQALEFTDHCLGIADFIVPAMWEKTFSTVHLLTELIPTRIENSSVSVKLMKGSTTVLQMENDDFLKKAGRGAPWLRTGDSEAEGAGVTCTLKTGGLNDIDRYPDSGLVLDVDLDYFCWDNSVSTGIPQRIEITQDAYNSFMNDRDHPFRILASRILDVVEEDGRYWLFFVMNTPKDPIPDDMTILRRMDRLFYYFWIAGVKPLAIDICRSAKSGYLPAQKAEFVEKNFLGRLERMFSVEYCN